MKLLKDILFKVAIESVKGTTDLKINALHFDSRKVAVNDVFFAIPGVVSDGHDFIDKAINQGASVIICERLPELLKEEVTYVKVNKTSEALALMASAFYDHPSESLILVGVTGTNGKTTVASMLFALFKNLGFKTGLLSTVNITGDQEDPQKVLSKIESNIHIVSIDSDYYFTLERDIYTYNLIKTIKQNDYHHIIHHALNNLYEPRRLAL